MIWTNHFHIWQHIHQHQHQEGWSLPLLKDYQHHEPGTIHRQNMWMKCRSDFHSKHQSSYHHLIYLCYYIRYCHLIGGIRCSIQKFWISPEPWTKELDLRIKEGRKEKECEHVQPSPNALYFSKLRDHKIDIIIWTDIHRIPALKATFVDWCLLPAPFALSCMLFSAPWQSKKQRYRYSSNHTT